MNKVGEIWRRLVLLIRRDRLERELEEEMLFHLEMKTQDNLDAGMSPEEARRAARLQFGNRVLAKEDSREWWGFGWLDRLAQDLSYGARTLAKSPGFTTIAVLSLALGIGANTAIFSVVNAVLLRPLPFKDPDQLALVYRVKVNGDESIPADAVVLAWKEESQAVELISHASTFVMTGRFLVDGKPEWLRDQVVGADTFRLLGVEPLLGRTFLPEDMEAEWASRGVVISHGLWQRVFGGDPNIIGRLLRRAGSTQEDDRLHEIVGVMPRGFWIYPWTADADVWLASSTPDTNWQPIARLKPGTEARQAEAELAVIAEHVKTTGQYSAATRGYEVRPFDREMAWKYGGALNLVLGAVSFVLLIACVNVANLLLGRAAWRQREFATRAALGAGRSRLVRQLLTESMLLSGMGGLLGLAVALVGIKLFVLLAPHWYLPAGEIGIDDRVLVYMLGISVLTGLVFGVAPALKASKPNLNASLKEGARNSTGAARRNPQRALAVSETALALILLAGAGLMISSFIRMLEADRGFDSEDVLAMEIKLTGPKYRSNRAATMTFYQGLLERIEGLPGVVSAGMTSYGVVSDGGGGEPLLIPGRPVPLPGELLRARYNEVGGQYFNTLGIPLLKGRLFTARDSEGAPPVAIVSQGLARRVFPAEDPIGKVVETPVAGEAREIVGVVGDVVHAVRDGPKSGIYIPYRQHTKSHRGSFFTFNQGFVIRTSVEPMSLAESLRSIVSELDKEMAPISIAPLERVVRERAGRPAGYTGVSEAQALGFYVRLLSIFAGLALFLAAIGLYGVISYSVARRTHEFGLRMALGAQRSDILRSVLKEGLVLSLLGLGIGVVASLGLTRLIESQLYGVTATDPATFATVSAVLVGVALLAAYIPARRAASVDPLVALRHE
jgi:putative ABC transport system permease protein